MKKPQPSATPSRNAGAVKTAPTPDPAPPDPEADKKRFEEALAAPTTSEKARLLRIFLDEFPVTSYAEEAVEYLVTARAMTGSERLESGDVNDALASFQLAVDEAPTPVPDRLFNDVILKSVLNLYQRGQQKAALELAGRIEKKVAANGKQLLGLAAIYLGTENGAEARRLAEAAIAADPGSAAGFQALGLAHRLNFDLESAAAAYARALELDPNILASRRSLAEMKRALGRSDEAVAIYRSILATNENDIPSRTGLVLSLFDSGKRSDAETELAAALGRDPRNFTLLAGAAYWYAANNQGARAVELAQKAIDAEPRYVWGHIALGRGLMKENRPVDAERALIKARQFGNFPTLDYEIASARFMAGLYREAIEELGKNFTIKDGVVTTRLGGRIASEGKTFQEAIGSERRASILAPVAADDGEVSEKMRLLFEVTRKVEVPADDAELSSFADEFVRGEDRMKLHRQLHLAQLFLQKNVALAKVSELLKASLGNADAGLDVPAPGAAVMASELYESRAVAFSRNEVIVIPEVPRATLSAILRGRIEELSGWALYQQKSYPEAVVRLRRAVSVLPDKSAWWRSSMWRLGTALEADGKDKEALDTYIRSYKIDRPNALRYGVIESLYIKVNGSREGLEDQIGANPQSAVSALPQKTETKSLAPSTVPVAEPGPEVKDAPKPEAPRVGNETASAQVEQKTSVSSDQRTDSGHPQKLDAKTLLTEKDKTATESVSKQEPEPQAPKVVEAAPTETKAETKQAETVDPKVEGASIEPKTEKPPIIVRSADARPSDLQPKESAENKIPAVTLAELLRKKRPAESVTAEEKGDVVSTELALKQALAVPEAPKFQNDVSTASSENSGETTTDKVTDQGKDVVPAEKAETDTSPVKKDDLNAVPVEPPRTDPQKTDAEPVDNKTAKQEPANLLRDPFAESSAKPPETKAAKAEVIIDDPLKPAEKVPEPKPDNKTLFEPIVITVPQTWKQSGKPTDGIKVQNADAPAESAKKPDGGSTSPGATRTRLVEGKEVLSDQRCSVELSDEDVSLLNGGGSIGVLVTIVGDGTLKELAASTNSPRDVEVKPEPEIEGLPGRRFYVIKSISTRTGLFQVNFESPCGKKEITVRVK